MSVPRASIPRASRTVTCPSERASISASAINSRASRQRVPWKRCLCDGRGLALLWTCLRSTGASDRACERSRTSLSRPTATQHRRQHQLDRCWFVPSQWPAETYTLRKISLHSSVGTACRCTSCFCDIESRDEFLRSMSQINNRRQHHDRQDATCSRRESKSEGNRRQQASVLDCPAPPAACAKSGP